MLKDPETGEEAPEWTALLTNPGSPNKSHTELCELDDGRTVEIKITRTEFGGLIYTTLLGEEKGHAGRTEPEDVKDFEAIKESVRQWYREHPDE